MPQLFFAFFAFFAANPISHAVPAFVDIWFAPSQGALLFYTTAEGVALGYYGSAFQADEAVSFLSKSPVNGLSNNFSSLILFVYCRLRRYAISSAY